MTKQYDIISLNNHLYMVDKEAVIREEDWVYDTLSLSHDPLFHKVWQIYPEHYTFNSHVHWRNSGESGNKFLKINYIKVVASTDPSLGLSLLPKVEEDINILAEKYSNESGDILTERLRRLTSKTLSEIYSLCRNIRKYAFKEGYKAASVKKYTEEDIRKAIKFGSGAIGLKFKNIDEFIQSLTPKPIAVEVEMEQEYYDEEKYKIAAKPKTKDNIVVIKKWIYESN